jgi:hypothetical protein
MKDSKISTLKMLLHKQTLLTDGKAKKKKNTHRVLRRRGCHIF